MATSFSLTAGAYQLEEVSGRVLVETGSGIYQPYASGSSLTAGDRVIVMSGGAAQLVDGKCRAELPENTVQSLSEATCHTLMQAGSGSTSTGGSTPPPSGSGGSGISGSTLGIIGTGIVVGGAVYVANDDNGGGSGLPPSISP